MPPPRLFGIPATRAPIVAVMRRGPSAWSHVGKWDVGRGVYEPGAWIKANLYPQRCDLSPDGRWLCYFTLKASARWKAGPTYIGISRLPWLTALAAWGTCGTWTRGLHFVVDRKVWHVQDPAEGDAGPCRKKLGLALTRPAAFAVERRRGWTESPETPPRRESDLWDEQRAVTMEKPHPRAGVRVRLRVQGRFAAFRSSLPGEGKVVRYEVVDDGQTTALDSVQWADWDAEGRLLVATTNGRLQVRSWSLPGEAPQSEIDLNAFAPNPSPPPKEANRW